MSLRLLPQHIINRIAAGEVVERPASVVKEVVENAIDAGATSIRISIRQSGRNLIRVEDNGAGMSKDDVALCLERHATSKLPDDDLWNIRFMGFRGEALASIASVARVTVTSKTADAEEAWGVSVEGGGEQRMIPVARSSVGTVIDIKDLFFATPARLKFLKHDRTEQNHICETVYRQALAHPSVAFFLENETKTLRDLPIRGDDVATALRGRLDDIIDKTFSDNALEIDTTCDNGYRLTGYAGLPTYHRSNSNHLYLFVNDRPVKDKTLHAAVRAAYQDYLPRMRFPVVVLFLTVPAQDVDVNVHPAKIEVRFRHDDRVRSCLIRGLRDALKSGGFRTATTIATTALEKAKPSRGVSPFLTSGTPDIARPKQQAVNLSRQPPTQIRPLSDEHTSSVQQMNEREYHYDTQHTSPSMTPFIVKGSENTPEMVSDAGKEAPSPEPSESELFLGTAMCQLHDNYIVAQTDTAITIIDQHAAHERLRYERLKADFRRKSVAIQPLLIPEIVELGCEDVAVLAPHCEALIDLGLDMATFGERGVIVRGIPAILGECDVQAMIRALADDMAEYGQAFSLQEHLDDILSFVACRGAIRSGNRISREEMDALLRDMERTPYSGQCNHGRPTYVTLEMKDIERLFGRT